MNNHSLAVPPRAFQWGRNTSTIIAALLVATSLAAQQMPPIPGGDSKPRDPTPEELEAMRQAREALWTRNREAIAPYLVAAPAPEPVDPVARQRLISAELRQREEARATDEQRKQTLLNWAAAVGDRQRATKTRAEALAKEYGYTLRGEASDGTGVEVDLVGDRLVFIVPHNLDAAKTISTFKARTGAPPALSLTGGGVKLGLWDFGVVGTNHVEFTSGGAQRVLWVDTNNVVDPTSHSTLMAGTMVATGVVAAAQGMAYDAQVLAYDRSEDYGKMGSASVQHGLRLSNHSYGPEAGWSKFVNQWLGDPSASEDELFGAYTEASFNMDELAYTNPRFLAVWSVGNGRDATDYSGANHFHIDGTGPHTDSHNANDFNYGGYGTISARATAKNIVSVGAVGDLLDGFQGAGNVAMMPFSCWGPTDDGRIAPLIVANGTNVYSTSLSTGGTLGYGSGTGTSPAAASVTGSLGLLVQRFLQLGRMPLAATLRALLAHTADDAGNPGPDHQFGFGLMNTARAADLILANAVTYNAYGGQLFKDGHLLEHVLENGQTNEFIVVQKDGEPLKLTLAWTDPPGNYSSVAGQLNPTTRMLVNNLHVEVVESGVKTNHPFSLNRDQPFLTATATNLNHVDNHLQVVVPPAGSPTFLTVRVWHDGTLLNGYYGTPTNQPYSVWVSGHEVLTKAAISLLTQTGSNTVAVAWSANVGSDYRVQYIDEVDAPASAWTDATGTITAQSPLVAVEVNYSPGQPQRFYRIKTL